MNILANSLKGSFVSAIIPPICPTQKMQFHNSSPLKNLFENNPLPVHNLGKSFKNPNIFDQNTHGEKVVSSCKNISQFDVTRDETVEKSSNSCEMVPEKLKKVDFSSTDSPETQEVMASRKRTRRSKSRRKLIEKHNNKRQVLNEMMDLDYCNDQSDVSPMPISEDQETSECHTIPLKHCDLLVLPDHSSPIRVPTIDVAYGSPKIPVQTTCFAFSISPPNCRQRQISVSESEDSFIVFDSGTDEECDFSDDAGSDSDEDSEDESDTDSPGSVVPTKMVRFADDKDLCEVHPMIQWSYAYQAARKGPWEMYARDRERFKNRIRHVECKLIPCFEPEHRQKVFDQRFRDRMDDC